LLNAQSFSSIPVYIVFKFSGFIFSARPIPSWFASPVRLIYKG